MKKFLNRIVESGVDALNKGGNFLEDNPEVLSTGRDVVLAVSTNPVVRTLGREVTKDKILSSIGKCGKSGVAGGVIDGLLGAGHAMKMHRAGIIDKDVVIRHSLQEAGCGLLTSVAGTAGTVTVALLMGGMGPASLIVGMGASVGTRYLYRAKVESVLPDLEEAEDDDSEADLEEILEELNYAILEDDA